MSHHLHDRARRLEKASTAFAAFAFLFAASVAFWAFNLRTEPFEPLAFSPQRIESVTESGLTIIPQIEGFEGPAVFADGTVPVRGTLTVTADAPVDVIGTIVWETTDPPGTRFVIVANAPNTLTPGVHALEFANPVPAEVTAHVDKFGVEKWRVSGAVEVLAPGGIDAVWSTESFWLVTP